MPLLMYQSHLYPNTPLGKWSVCLNNFFLVGVAVSVLLVNGLGALSYDDHWWDITVPILFSAAVFGFILGIIVIRKYKERAYLVYASVGVGLVAILFILLHSLFIND